MKKVLVGLVASLLLGTTLFVSVSNPQPEPARADALSAFMIPKSACIALFTGAIGGIALGCLDGPEALDANLNVYAEDIGDADGEIEPEDFATLETFGGRQLHEDDGYAYIIVFVDDQTPVRFRIDNDGGAFNVGDSTNPLNVNEFICDTTAEDTDCVDTVEARDNGIVVIGLCSGAIAPGCTGGTGARTGDRGEHRLSIDQEQVPVDVDYTIVGEADEISLTVFESTINNGVVDQNGDGDLSDSDECPLAASVAGFTAALNQGEKTVVIGRAVDSDGQGITAAWIEWDTDDHDVGDFTSTRQTPTLNLGSFGFGAPQILCGTDKPGILELQANIVPGPQSGGSYVALDPNADTEIDTTFDVTVRGVPKTVEVSVTPSSINCDGIASVEAAATVKDVNGDLVANGQSVKWSVQVLGTVAPLTSSTADGIAKSTVVPLSGANRGVPVIATAGDAQGSALVACGPTAGGGGAAPPPGGGAAPGGGGPSTGGGTIGGPDTGNGGYLNSGDTSLPMWPAIPLLALLAAMVLARARAGAPR